MVSCAEVGCTDLISASGFFPSAVGCLAGGGGCRWKGRGANGALGSGGSLLHDGERHSCTVHREDAVVHSTHCCTHAMVHTVVHCTYFRAHGTCCFLHLVHAVVHKVHGCLHGIYCCTIGTCCCIHGTRCCTHVTSCCIHCTQCCIHGTCCCTHAICCCIHGTLLYTRHPVEHTLYTFVHGTCCCKHCTFCSRITPAREGMTTASRRVFVNNNNLQLQTLSEADGDGRGGGRSERWDPVGLACIKNMESRPCWRMLSLRSRSFSPQKSETRQHLWPLLLDLQREPPHWGGAARGGGLRGAKGTRGRLFAALPLPEQITTALQITKMEATSLSR